MTFRTRKHRQNTDLILSEEKDSLVKPKDLLSQHEVLKHRLQGNDVKTQSSTPSKVDSTIDQFKVGSDTVIYDKESGLWKIKK